MYDHLLTPAVLVDVAQLDANISTMQSRCDAFGVELRPHVKTHKLVAVARRQLAAGAAGFTCAKIGEAEMLLPAFEGHTGRREFFIGNSLADIKQAPRLRALREKLDDLVVACTSELHYPVLAEIAGAYGSPLPVMMAVDTGLHREGARDLESAVRLAQAIESDPRLELRGLYTHEGHFYGVAPEDRDAELQTWFARFTEIRAAIEAKLGRSILLWPGCSVTSYLTAAFPGVNAVRPGSYVFSDLSLCEVTRVRPTSDTALKILTTVVDRPEPGLALIDAGGKTFSSDKTPTAIFARCGSLVVTRVSEEHGFVTGDGVDDLKVGQRLQFTPAHVCPVLNLAAEVVAVQDETVLENWPVEARGQNR